MRYMAGAVLVLTLLAGPAWAVFVDDFDSYANGNLSGQGTWTRGNAGTSWIQIVDRPGGGKMVWIRGGDTGSGDRTVGSEAMAGMTGTISVEFDILKNGLSGNTSWSVLLDDTSDSPDGNFARAYGTGANARGRIDGQGIVTPVGDLAEGWNRVKIAIDTATDTDTFYLNGVLLGSISYAGFSTDILQRVSLHKVNPGQDVYLDNLSITPEPASLLLLAVGGLLLRRRSA